MSDQARIAIPKELALHAKARAEAIVKMYSDAGEIPRITLEGSPYSVPRETLVEMLRSAFVAGWVDMSLSHQVRP